MEWRTRTRTIITVEVTPTDADESAEVKVRGIYAHLKGQGNVVERAISKKKKKNRYVIWELINPRAFSTLLRLKSVCFPCTLLTQSFLSEQLVNYIDRRVLLKRSTCNRNRSVVYSRELDIRLEQRFQGKIPWIKQSWKLVPRSRVGFHGSCSSTMKMLAHACHSTRSIKLFLFY